MLEWYSVLAWQSFTRTSRLLSSKLAGVILDKPFSVVHTGREYLGQATLVWRNPARTILLPMYAVQILCNSWRKFVINQILEVTVLLNLWLAIVLGVSMLR